MKKPFLNSFGAAVYIVVIVFIVKILGTLLKNENETIAIPMAVLSLFVLSAAVMGYLFLAEPLRMLVEGKKQEALAFFGKVVGFFACFVLVFAVLVFVV